MKSKSVNPKNLEAVLSEKQQEIDALKKELDLLRSQSSNQDNSDSFVFSNFVFENTNDVMFLLKPNGKNNFTYLKVNRVFLKTVNLEEIDVIGKSIQDLLPLKEANISIENFNIAYKTKDQVIFEETIEFADRTAYYETTLTPILDKNNIVKFITGIARNITSKKISEIAKQQSDDKYKKLFEQANDAIIIFDPQTEKVLEVNKKATEIYGFTAEEFLNVSLKSITKNVNKGEVHIEETIKKNSFINFETRQFNKNGDELTLLVSASVIDYNGGKAIMSINRDITELKKKEILIAQAQNRIVNIANNFPNGAIFQYIVDYSKNINEVTFMSEGAHELFGCSPEELIINPLLSYNLILPEDLAGFLEAIAFARIYMKDFEYTYRIKVNGKIKWAHTRIKQTQLNNGSVQWDGITIDITNNKLTELSLIESQRFLNTLINNLPGFAYRISNQTSEVQSYISDGILKLTGYDANLFKENPDFFTEIIHPDDKVHLLKAHKNAELNKSSYDNEYRIITKDKRTKWIWDRGECALNKKGDIIAFEGFVTDITEAKVSEQIITAKSIELERQRAFYNNIIENLPVAVFVKDAKNDLKFTLWNKKAEEIYGFTKKELIGKNAFDIWEKEKADRYYQEDLEVSKKNRILELPDNFVELKSGESIYLNSKKVPLMENESGEVSYILCVSEDITNSRRQAEALKQSEAVLNTLFASAPIPMFLSSAISGKIVMANKELEKLLNIPITDLIGNATPNFYVNPEERKVLLEKVLNEIKVYNYDLQIHDLKGNILDIVISSELIEINGEKMIFSGFLDVSGTKKQNKLLKESISLIQATLNSTVDGILAIDLEGNVTLYNDRVLDIWGVTAEDLLITQDNKLNREVIISKVKNQEEYIQNSKAFIENVGASTLYRFELLNGKIIERYTIPQKIDGEIVGRVGSFRDITESVNTFKELEESKALLEETNNLAKVGGWELDLINNKLSWSNITKEIHEVPMDFTPELETAINFYKDGVDRDRITTAVEHGIKFAIPWDLELQIVTANGNYRWVRANGKPEFEDGKCIRLFGTFQDIHEKKLLDLALQESEEHHRILFEKSPLIKITLDSEGTILAINEKGILELGFDKDEIMGISFLQFVNQKDINIFESNLNESKNIIGRTYTSTIEAVSKNEGIILLSVSATALQNSNNEIIISLVCENITKEKEIENALLNSEANLRTVFESTDVGYVLCDINANILTFNTPAYFFTIKEFKKELMQGVNILDYVSINRLEYVKDVLENVFKGEKIEQEIKYTSNFDEITWYEVIYSPVKSKDNVIVGLVLSMKDITQSKLIQNELNNTLLKVETTNNKLQEIIQQKDKFFSIIAHDLRSPFSGFIGLTELITQEFQDLSNDELRDLTNELNKSANNLFKLLENLLEWSRIQRGLVKFNLEYFSLFEKMQKNIDLITSKADLKSININNKVPFDTFVNADTQMLDVVIRNILSNAVKFTNIGGQIEVFARHIDNFIEVQIKDNGIGIPEDILGELFEIDSKSSRIGTSGEPSTGLGLLLCKEYIEKHNGKIWAVNNQDKGSSFYFTISNSSISNKSNTNY